MSRPRLRGTKEAWTSVPGEVRVVTLGVFVAVTIVGALAVLFLIGTAYWVDRKLADESGAHAAASVRTRDAEPGDDVYIQTWPLGNKGAIDYANGRLVVTRLGNEVRSIAFPGGSSNPTVTLPIDLTVGDRVRAVLEVNGTEKTRGAFGREGFQERLELDIPVASSSLPGKALHVGLAALGWFVAAGICYLLARSRFGLANLFGRIDIPADRSGGSFLAWLCVMGMLAILGTGHVVFTRPILMTTAISSVVLQVSLGVVWVAGLIGGGWLGTRRRREAMRWNPARLRAVEGSRSKLPAALSRPVDAAPAEAVTKALIDAGFEVSARGGGLQLVRGGVVVVRIRAAGPRWLPEDLKIEVRDRHDAVVIAEALVPIFGALELLPPFGEPVTREPQSSL